MKESVLYTIVICCGFVNSFPDQGQWTKSYVKESDILFGMHKTLYSGSSVSLSVNCEPINPSKKVNITISWVLRQTSCFEEYLGPEILGEFGLHSYFDCPMTPVGYSRVRYIESKPESVECSSRIHLDPSNASFVSHGKDSGNNPQKQCLKGPGYFAEQESEITAGQDFIENDMKPVVKTKTEETKDTKRKTRNAILNNKSEAGKSPSDPQAAAQEKIPTDSKSAENSSQSKKQKSEESGKVKGKDNQAPGKIEEKENVEAKSKSEQNAVLPVLEVRGSTVKPGSHLAVVDMDGVYLFILNIQSGNKEQFNLTVDVTMKGDYGYLSAVDWPLLPFYGFMCGIYVIYAFAWLFVSALQWRDLLRIQFWIGGVILLGLMEKAVFYAEYQSINSTGQSVQGAVLFAEILSCMKRTLARMLVIIVSLGFGIVKPRLGPMLHRVVGVGSLYFILGTIEGCLRVLKPKNDPSNQALMAGIPLAVTDSAICWWIFSSLVQTIRTLRLRRNLVKLSLYRHFTNTLIFAVLASVAYMIWSIHSHKLVNCITDWKELWVDEAYWHLLFSVVLVVIMILWRPTNNNQRYAFTPLLDAADDDEDEEEDLSPPNDAFAGMKMRTAKNQSNVSPKQNDAKNKPDDDLKWVEENIPSSLTDAALPSLLDSDEEIMTAKFERSKME